ncbi:MAG: protein kinase [Kofleriaceae bacterium]|nr:protein kinase [Kofleriaceae bacterium]
MGVRPLIVKVTDTTTGASYTAAFDESPILIGRGEDVSLRLDREHVSAHHATLAFDDRHLTFSDLDSRNGSIVDGVVYGIGHEIPLTESSDVRLGNLKLTFSRDALRRPSADAPNPFVSPERAPKSPTGVLTPEAIDRIRREVLAAKAPPPAAPEPTPEWLQGPVPQLRPERDLTEVAPPSWLADLAPSAPAPSSRPPADAPLPRTAGWPEPPAATAPPPQAPPRPPENASPQAAPEQPLPEPYIAGTIPTGTIVGGRYRLLGLLGRGGMGAVYRAHDENLNVPVAIKTLASAGQLTPEMLERFFREAKVIRAVSHPNIVVVHDVGMDDGLPYIAMELLKGEDLGAAIERAPLEIPDAADIMLGVCAGLQAAHERGLVHRDLKPQNIFLSQAWRVQDVPKILDFGISKTSDSKLTNAGDIMGTEHYLSPEQAMDSNAVDARSDIYALGVILYQCIAQRPPHDGANIYLVIKSIVEGNARPLRSVRPDVPEEFAAIVHRAMAMEPKDRYASAHELARELLPFASARGQRVWSDHYSTAPPADPMISAPHATRGDSSAARNQAAAPQAAAPQVLAGGTRRLPQGSSVEDVRAAPLTPARAEEKSQRRVEREREDASPPVKGSKRTVWLVLVGVVLGVGLVTVLSLVRGGSRPELTVPAPVQQAPEPSARRMPTPEPPAPVQATPSAPAASAAQVVEPAATEPSPAAAEAKPRPKRKRVKYNADGVPLVE